MNISRSEFIWGYVGSILDGILNSILQTTHTIVVNMCFLQALLKISHSIEPYYPCKVHCHSFPATKLKHQFSCCSVSDIYHLLDDKSHVAQAAVRKGQVVQQTYSIWSVVSPRLQKSSKKQILVPGGKAETKIHLPNLFNFQCACVNELCFSSLKSVP